MTDEALRVNTETEVCASGIAHGFDTGYAIAYGVDEAIMIRNLQFFITANANRGHNFRDGRFWTYDRLEDFPKHFPYWSIKQIRRIIASLVEQEVIIKAEYNDKWSDRTQWYAFKDQDKFIKNIKPPKEKKPTLADLPKRSTDSLPNGTLSDDQMGNCIYDTSSIASAISSSSSLKVPEEPMAAKAAEVIDSPPLEKPKRTRTPPEFSTKVRALAESMIAAMIRTKPDYAPPKNLSPFMTHVDYMLRLDNRDPEKLMDVFCWALADHFWSDKMFKKNAAEYFREKYDQLDMKMNAKPAPKERKFAASSNDQAAIEKMEEMTKRAL